MIMFQDLIRIFILIYCVSGAAILPHVRNDIDKRLVQYVTEVKTVQAAVSTPTALAAGKQNTPANTVQTAAAAATAATNTSPSDSSSGQQSSSGFGSFFADLLNSMRGSLSSQSLKSNQATAAVNTPSVQSTGTSASSGSSGKFDLWDLLFGHSSSSSSTQSTSSSQEPDSGISLPTSATSSMGYSSLSVSATSATDSILSSSSSVSNDPSPNAYVQKSISLARGAKGITYSPYKKDYLCKSASEVAYDIKRLSGFELIRLYSTDCNAIENILLTMTSSQKLFLGIYEIDQQTIVNGLSTIKQEVEGSSRGWSAVHTISVGNERVNDGKSTVQDLTTALKTTRSWLEQYAPNYNGYVVTVDTLVAAVAHTGICEISDYIAVNCHPYWDGGVYPQNSGSWLQQQIKNLQNACGTSKPILITETGWPTKGDTNGVSVPSPQNQIAAIRSINSVLSSKVLMFTMYNDYWKNPGSKNVEQDWGIFGDPQV